MTFKITVRTAQPDGTLIPVMGLYVSANDLMNGKIFGRSTDGNGYGDVAAPGFEPGHRVTVKVDDPTYRYQGIVKGDAYEVGHTDMTLEYVVVPFERPVASLPALIAAGPYLRLATGDPFTLIEASAFNLLGRLCHEGEGAIASVVDELQEIGFNAVRVWTAYSGNAQFQAEIGRLLPSEDPELYAGAAELSRICARRGLYIEFTGYTGPDNGSGGVTVDHWPHLGEALQPVAGQVLGELVNEHDSHPSLHNINSYQPLPGILCSRGSNGSDRPPPRPWMQYELYHTNDAFEWWRKGGHNGMEFSVGAEGLQGSGCPVIANENTRPDHDGTLLHHEDAACAAAGLIAGSCFHSQSGKRASNLSAADRPFAEAHVRGARRFDLRFQPGRYSHVLADEGPEDLRVYRKTLPSGEVALIEIRK